MESKILSEWICTRIFSTLTFSKKSFSNLHNSICSPIPVILQPIWQIKSAASFHTPFNDSSLHDSSLKAQSLWKRASPSYNRMMCAISHAATINQIHFHTQLSEGKNRTHLVSQLSHLACRQALPGYDDSVNNRSSLVGAFNTVKRGRTSATSFGRVLCCSLWMSENVGCHQFPRLRQGGFAIRALRFRWKLWFWVWLQSSVELLKLGISQIW